ncbi:MAG: exodeoxyribonuclease VII large subunit [Arcobacteraceae bacterium]|nr:exodeoxyribonuclease VII large subunit [Arcobacteraceae bacterium]
MQNNNSQLSTNDSRFMPLSVSELNNQIKSLLESTFISVYVEGEISNLTVHSSGHIYFSIKDKDSNISCVMFKGNAFYLKFKLEVGQKVTINGSITAYTPRGSYQLICSKIEPSGIGSLALAYEQLKKKFQTLGYFDSSHKKPLPKFPKLIAIVTSPTGAAIEDMKKIANQRWPLTKIVLIPTLVQGENAKFDIVSSIKYADSLKADIMIVGRGGGSLEDLWSFNEEIVCEAIFSATTPIISAVGHESDFMLSDLVADMRASTPSNAIELSLPSQNDMQLLIDDIRGNLSNYFLNNLSRKTIQLQNLKTLFNQNSIESKILNMQNIITHLKTNFDREFLNILNLKTRILSSLQENFILNEPSIKIKTGFVQILKDNKITNLELLNMNDTVELTDSKFILEAKITQKILIK